MTSERARDWEVQSSPEDAAVRLAQAMYRGEKRSTASIMRATVLEPVMVGRLQVQQVGEYRGSEMKGLVLRVRNTGTPGAEPRREHARCARRARLHGAGEPARRGPGSRRLPHPVAMEPGNGFPPRCSRKSPRRSMPAQGEDGSPLGDAMAANEAVKRKQMLLLGSGGAAALVAGSFYIFGDGPEQEQQGARGAGARASRSTRWSTRTWPRRNGAPSPRRR
jgi:hypothetical protein